MSAAAWLACALAVAPPTLAFGDVEDDLARAAELRAAGRSAEAVQLLDRALDDEPDDERLRGALGSSLIDVGDADRAGALARELGDYAGDEYRVHQFLGRYHEARGDATRAMESYRAATRSNRAAAEASRGIVGLHIRGGKLGRALKEAQRLTAVDRVAGRRLEADVLEAQGDQYQRSGPETVELAAERYRLAYERAPEDAELGQKLIDCLVIATRIDEALAAVERVHGHDRESAAYVFHRGRCLAAGKDVAGAREAYERAHTLAPAAVEAALELAKLSLDEGDMPTARQWLATHVEHHGESMRSFLMMGDILFALDELQGAEANLREALKRSPNNAKGLYLLGRLLVRTGRREEGAELLARYREMQMREVEAAREP